MREEDKNGYNNYMVNYIKKVKSAKLILIFGEINLGGGGSKSLISYIQNRIFTGEEVVYIVLRERFAYLKLLIAAIWGRQLIVNGLFCCRSWVVKWIFRTKKRISLYTHESSYYFKQFIGLSGGNQRFLKNVLSKKHVLYASEWQYRNTLTFLDPQRKDFVFECLSIDAPAYNLLGKDWDRPIIGMAGFIQERKGVDRFEELATEASQLKFSWEFVWIGGKAGSKIVPKNTCVNYLGPVDGTLHFLSKIDLLLFTAYEDPLPLVILEAVVLKKRILCYKENGFVDILKGISGVAFFGPEDSNEDILAKAKRLLSNGIDHEAYERIASQFAFTGSFVERLDGIL